MSAMLLAAVFHPPPNTPAMRKLPDEYRLSRQQLVSLLPLCTGLPVTFEHSGIHAAMSRLRHIEQAPTPVDVTLALETSDNAVHRTLGHVTEVFEAKDGGFWAIMSVDFTNKPGLYHLIQHGMLQSVSLTHMVDAEHDCIRPLEMALVGNPARPGCRIRYATKSGLNMSLYKASVQVGTTLTMDPNIIAASAAKMETDSTGATTVEEALQQMSPEHRTLIAEKLAYLVSCMDTQKQQLVAANASLANKSYDHETDNALLKSQIAQLWAAMDETAKQNLAVPPVDALSKSLLSNNANEIRQNVLKTIMCCNQSMMLKAMTSAPLPAKKKARVQEQPIVAASAVTAAEADTLPVASQEELLRRALTETFEM